MAGVPRPWSALPAFAALAVGIILLLAFLCACQGAALRPSRSLAPSPRRSASRSGRRLPETRQPTRARCGSSRRSGSPIRLPDRALLTHRGPLDLPSDSPRREGNGATRDGRRLRFDAGSRDGECQGMAIGGRQGRRRIGPIHSIAGLVSRAFDRPVCQGGNLLLPGLGDGVQIPAKEAAVSVGQLDIVERIAARRESKRGLYGERRYDDGTASRIARCAFNFGPGPAYPYVQLRVLDRDRNGRRRKRRSKSSSSPRRGRTAFFRRLSRFDRRPTLPESEIRPRRVRRTLPECFPA